MIVVVTALVGCTGADTGAGSGETGEPFPDVPAELSDVGPEHLDDGVDCSELRVDASNATMTGTLELVIDGTARGPWFGTVHWPCIPELDGALRCSVDACTDGAWVSMDYVDGGSAVGEAFTEVDVGFDGVSHPAPDGTPVTGSGLEGRVEYLTTEGYLVQLRWDLRAE